MNITFVLFGIIFLAIGVLFAFTNLYQRLDMWKKMPEDERAGIDIRPLCHNIGALIALCGFVFLVGGFFSLFRENFFIWAMIGWFVVGGVDIYFISKSKRYKLTGTKKKALRS